MNYLKIVTNNFSNNVLVSTSKVTAKFYPESIDDNFDDTVMKLKIQNLKIKLNLVKMF